MDTFWMQITYCPDCTRAVTYDTEAVVGGGETVKGKEFYNYIFGCLFLNETNHVSQLWVEPEHLEVFRIICMPKYNSWVMQVCQRENTSKMALKRNLWK